MRDILGLDDDWGHLSKPSLKPNLDGGFPKAGALFRGSSEEGL